MSRKSDINTALDVYCYDGIRAALAAAYNLGRAAQAADIDRRWGSNERLRKIAKRLRARVKRQLEGR